MPPTDPTQYDPNDPRVIRPTSENVKDLFDRITTNVAQGGNGVMEPGWRCKGCGWTVPGIGVPPPHVCQAVNQMPPRKVAILSLNLVMLTEMMKAQGPVTFFVKEGLPADAKILGANVSAPDILQLVITSEAFGEAGVGPDGQLTLPAALPVIYFTMVPVTTVVELGEEELVEYAE